MLNCWKTLKSVIPQHKDEICLSATVTKVEKNNRINIWLNPKYLIAMGNQQPSPEEGKAQRLSRKGVGYKRLVAEVALPIQSYGIDIVWPLVKIKVVKIQSKE